MQLYSLDRAAPLHIQYGSIRYEVVGSALRKTLEREEEGKKGT